jgi:hypothetical protein
MPRKAESVQAEMFYSLKNITSVALAETRFIAK